MKLNNNTQVKAHLIIKLLVITSLSFQYSISLNSKSNENFKHKSQNMSKNKLYTKFLTNFLLKKTAEQKNIGRSFLSTLLTSSHNFLGKNRSESFNINFFEKSSRTIRTKSQAQLKRYKSTLRNKIKSYRTLLKRLGRNKYQSTAKISSTKLLKKRMHQNDSDKYLQFKYYDYEEIVEELNKLKNVENGKWVKITTAQEEFGLQSPGGFCGKNKE